MTDASANKPAAIKRPQFWVAPLLVGCCFSLGYGVTQRVVTLQSNPETVQPESFAAAVTPGQSLSSLRRSSGEKGSLQVDVAALEAVEAAERDAKPKADAKARAEADARQNADLALNTPPAPAWTPADAIEPDVAAPPELEEPMLPDVVDLPMPDLQPELTTRPLLEAPAPMAPPLSNDFFVPVLPEAPPSPVP